MREPHFTHHTHFTGARDGLGGLAETRLIGEIDLAAAADLAAALELCVACRPHRVEIDLTRVSLLDCAGLNVLLTARRHAARRGIPLTLTGTPPPMVTRVLVLTGTPLGPWPDENRHTGRAPASTTPAETGQRRAAAGRPPTRNSLAGHCVMLLVAGGAVLASLLVTALGGNP
jgi:anti-anti-sigma factor